MIFIIKAPKPLKKKHCCNTWCVVDQDYEMFFINFLLRSFDGKTILHLLKVVEVFPMLPTTTDFVEDSDSFNAIIRHESFSLTFPILYCWIITASPENSLFWGIFIFRWTRKFDDMLETPISLLCYEFNFSVQSLTEGCFFVQRNRFFNMTVEQMPDVPNR